MNQIWRSCISQLDPQIEAKLGPMLSPREAEKLGKFSRMQRRKEYILSRTLMRMALSRHYEKPLQYWQFSESPNAAPQLINPVDKPVFISISHSGNWVMLALSDLPVGLDVEQTIRADPTLKIANKVFTPEQQQLISSLTENRAVQTFYQLWTQKEALVKAMAATGEPFQMFSTAPWPTHLFDLSHKQTEDYCVALASKYSSDTFSQYHAKPFEQSKNIQIL